MTDTSTVATDATMQATLADDDSTTLAHQGQAQLHMLTTIDNPFDPFTEYDQWDAWDQDAGYYSAAFLARIVITSADLSEADQDVAIENAIDEIVRENVSGMHTKVSKTS